MAHSDRESLSSYLQHVFSMSISRDTKESMESGDFFCVIPALEAGPKSSLEKCLIPSDSKCLKLLSPPGHARSSYIYCLPESPPNSCLASGSQRASFCFEQERSMLHPRHFIVKDVASIYSHGHRLATFFAGVLLTY